MPRLDKAPIQRNMYPRASHILLSKNRKLVLERIGQTAVRSNLIMAENHSAVVKGLCYIVFEHAILCFYGFLKNFLKGFPSFGFGISRVYTVIVQKYFYAKLRAFKVSRRITRTKNLLQSIVESIRILVYTKNIWIEIQSPLRTRWHKIRNVVLIFHLGSVVAPSKGA